MPNNKISRRNFILQSSAAITASLLPLDNFANPYAAKYKMGLQLFSIRGPLSRDVTGTIKQVAAIGYEDSETYGYDPEKK